MERVQIFSFVEGLKIEFRAFSSRGSSLMQSIAETCVRFDAAHLSINLVSEIAVPMFTTLIDTQNKPKNHVWIYHALSSVASYSPKLTAALKNRDFATLGFQKKLHAH